MDQGRDESVWCLGLSASYFLSLLTELAFMSAASKMIESQSRH